MRTVTVVLPVLNEEQNLPAALASVEGAARVIVVDSGSIDRTVEIATEAGAEVVQFTYDRRGPKKKAWILSRLDISTPWTLLLDADERISQSLREEIDHVLHDPDAATAYYLDRELHFMGRVMRSFQPNWNLRLFRTGSARMEDLGLEHLPGTGDNEIHEHVITDGRTGFITTPITHDDFRGLTAWIDRHNKYATWEAHLYAKFRAEPIGWARLLRADAFERKRILRRIWVRVPGRPVARFIIWYFGRRGFMDGKQGLHFCLLMAFYELMISLKLQELTRPT